MFNRIAQLNTCQFTQLNFVLHFAQHIKNGFDACTNLLSGKVVCLIGR